VSFVPRWFQRGQLHTRGIARVSDGASRFHALCVRRRSCRGRPPRLQSLRKLSPPRVLYSCLDPFFELSLHRPRKSPSACPAPIRRSRTPQCHGERSASSWSGHLQGRSCRCKLGARAAGGALRRRRIAHRASALGCQRLGTGASDRSSGRVRTREPSAPLAASARPMACGRRRAAPGASPQQPSAALPVGYCSIHQRTIMRSTASMAFHTGSITLVITGLRKSGKSMTAVKWRRISRSETLRMRAMARRPRHR
jgi:hypothetical protein